MGKRRGLAAKGKQHGMDVDAAAGDGWTAGAQPMDEAEGGATALPPPSLTSGGDGAASKSLGFYGVVVGGVKKRKVQLTFKQKRRKTAKVQKALAHAEVKGAKRSKASQATERKTSLKKLW